jgi:dTDP-4-dehydrorhamnose 3,5-epimerase-like enzyme
MCLADKPYLIRGEIHQDERGSLAFVNSFDLEKFRRFYIISPENKSVVRAWQGHQQEEKAFYCLTGSFVIVAVRIDNWASPSGELKPDIFRLSESESQILIVPGGYATGIKSNTNQAKLLVFSDRTLPESRADDFRYDPNNWIDWAKL